MKKQLKVAPARCPCVYMQGVLQRRKASLGADGQGRHFQKSLEVTFKNGEAASEACTKAPRQECVWCVWRFE